MFRECVAIGREPRNEKTEGFRVCPASKRKAETQRKKERVCPASKKKSETREEKRVCPASKRQETPEEKRECPAPRKGNYELQLVESLKNDQSS